MMAVSNGCHAAFLQIPMNSRGEGRRLNLQIQRSRRILNANIATTAHCLTPVLYLLRQAVTNATPTLSRMRGVYRLLVRR